MKTSTPQVESLCYYSSKTTAENVDERVADAGVTSHAAANDADDTQDTSNKIIEITRRREVYQAATRKFSLP